MASGGEQSTPQPEGPPIGRRIEQIRRARFSASRKGYDRAEVDRYLNALADWLEGLGLDRPDQGKMRRELEWVGAQTSRILTQAEEAARELSQKAAEDAERMRSEAQAEAERLRAESQDEARRAQLEASTRAEETVAEAERRAEEMIEQAARRRQDLEALIGDLIDRRDELVAEGNRLVDDLAELFATAAEGPAEEYEEDEELEEGEELAEVEELEGVEELEVDEEIEAAEDEQELAEDREELAEDGSQPGGARETVEMRRPGADESPGDERPPPPVR